MRRSPMVSNRLVRPAASVVAVAVIAFAFCWTAGVLPRTALPIGIGGLVAAVLLVALVALVGGAMWLFAWPAVAPTETVAEEPWFADPNLPATRGRPRVISICGLAPGAGSSTIALNLALHVACETVLAEGDGRRRPRALVLLQEGDLSRHLGMTSDAVRAYFEAHPVSTDDSLVELAARHPAGCEVLCVPSGLINAHRLRLVIDAVREHYDLVVLDCPIDDPWLADSASRLAAFTLLIGGPDCESAAIAAAEGAWRRGSEGRVALVLNRAIGSFRMPAWVSAGFVHWAVMPDDPIVRQTDATGHPWALREESRARRALAEMAAALVHDWLQAEVARAA